MLKKKKHFTPKHIINPRDVKLHSCIKNLNNCDNYNNYDNYYHNYFLSERNVACQGPRVLETTEELKRKVLKLVEDNLSFEGMLREVSLPKVVGSYRMSKISAFLHSLGAN